MRRRLKLFSGVQFKEFGKEFYQGEEFYCRYQSSRKLGGLYRSIFVPLGPCCENERGLYNFLDWLDQKRLNKILIELPLILDSSFKDIAGKTFLNRGYKATEYKINEGETMLTLKGAYKLSKDTAYKVRYGRKRAQLVVTDSPTLTDLNNAYSVYRESALRIGFQPKSLDAFKVLSDCAILVNAYIGGDCVGFILGYIFKSAVTADMLPQLAGNEATVCQIIFSGTNDQGRINKMGYALRDTLIKFAFEQTNVDVVDSLGASKRFDYSYYSFKKEFASVSVSLGGAYSRKAII